MKTTYGDPELIRWLNKDIKLFPAILDIEKQFQNWFYFQEILYKTGNPLKKILINKFDEYSTQKNIKAVKKHIIKLVGIEPKVEKGQSMIEEYLKAIKQHSKPIPVNPLLTMARKETTDVLNQLTKTLKVNDKKQVQSLVNNYEEKFIKTLPKKLQTIENSLHRFRDEKLIHEIQAVKLKQNDEEKERQWLMSLRDNELEKIHANHQFIKEQDKKIYEFWKYTETIKHNRINKEQSFNKMMTGRLVDIYNQKKNEDKKAMDQNIYLFLQTCIRQGIEIEKDPSKKPVPEKAKFSAVATMMKIRERTRKTEEARKARQKRRNKMLVEQVKQQELVEAKKKLEELVDKFAEYGKQANSDSQQRHIDKLRGYLQIKERTIQCDILEHQKETFFEQLRQEAKAREQEVRQQRQKEWRILQVQYMEQNYNRKVQKRQKHVQQMQPLILSILDLADKCYLKMNENLNENSKPLTLDKKMWAKFIEEWQNEICQVKPIQDSVAATITQDFVEYYHALKDWKSTQSENQMMANISLAEFLFEITDELYPMQALKEGMNFYLPLKISLIGGRFSGRKTTAKYLNQKYGLEIIDIEAINKEALKLAFPPPEDPKKKKDTKKVIEVPVVENPELKEYGIQINEYKDSVIPDELLLKGILIKLNQTFGQRTPSQVAQEIKEAREIQQKKESQPVVEEVKKVSKKPGKKEAQQTTGPSQEDLIKEYINSKQFYYTKGWVMIGFPETFSQAKMLEETLTGYIPYEERLNQIAEEKKKKFQELLDIPTQEESNKIQQSGIDLIINLDSSFEQRLTRMQNRRIDPLTENIYNLEENPPPPEIKPDKLSKIDSETEEKLQKEFQIFNDNLPKLIEWCEQFGFEEDFKQYHQITSVGKGFEVAKLIDPILNKVLTINIEYLNSIAEEILAQELKLEEQQQKSQEQEQEKVEEQSQQNEQVNFVSEREKQNTLDAKQSTEKGRSQLASRQKDLGQSDFLDLDQLKGILKQWDEISNTYIRESTIYIRRMSHQRKKCQQIFLQTQKQFLEFFESPDTKVKLLHEYQLSYNKFLQENDDLSKQKNAKQQLKDHLQKTYEQLWDVLNQRKNQALDFVKKLRSERFTATQIQQFMQHVLMLLQTETNLLTEIQLLGKPWSEHFILEPPQSQLIDGYKFPQLDVLITYYNECLEKITQGEESLIIKLQKEIAYKRGQIIRSVAYSKMTEMLVMEDILFSRIDDWIICGIKNQNDFCFQSINYLKKQIDDRQPAILTIPEPTPISENFKMVYMQQHLIPEQDYWRNMIQFYEEVKSLSDSVWIPFTVFESFEKRRSSFINKFKINIQKVAELGCFPNVRFSYQTLLIIMILFECRVPSQEEIQQLIDDLKSVEVEDQRDFWIEYSFWFDDYFTEKECNIKIYVKNLLFNVLQSQDIVVSAKENFGYFKQYENQLFSSIFDPEPKEEEEEEKNSVKK